MIERILNRHINNYSWTFRFGIVAIAGISLLVSCYPDTALNESVKTDDSGLITALDQHIEDDFTDKYGMAIRYRYSDRYVDAGRRVVPPRIDAVRPMLDFVQEYWLDPYLEVENGEDFFKQHVPAEIVFLGGPIFNLDGTITLGTADAGAQITFTNVNTVDPDNEDWRSLQLQTVYHEFAHTVHQLYKLPTAFETISPAGYTSAGSWFVLTDEAALVRGFVSPYATSNPNEDFAEMVAFFSFDPDFYDKFITLTDTCTTVDCENANLGKEMIAKKLSAITEHYEKVTGVKLEDVRNAIQAKF